ncbi:MAG: N-acetyltransferase [Dysgonamonadaceae bacterium]|jgi:GNAT superfamily N-acetyltransferase|nr:N-acetyltransferase [Dysgonamonadaceae bacterium]
MFDLQAQCTFEVLSDNQLITGFNCGDEELNYFFNFEALHFKHQLLAQTCFFRHNESGEVVCAFSISPNALKTTDLPGSRRKKVREYIPREKSLQSYPAFLVGRLGVAFEYNGKGIGTQLIGFIKAYCYENFPDFCRFLLIDAYNDNSILNFYQKNNFSFVFSTEEQERIAYRIDTTKPLETRYLFYDMIHWKNESAL